MNTTDKTDKQLVWEALKAIEQHTSGPNSTFYSITDSEWRELPIKDRLRIRGLLLSNGLISIIGNNQWMLQLTAAGMILKESDLKANGELRKKSNKELIRGLIIAAISALLGLVTATLQAKYLSDNQPKTIVLPKIQIVHDTIWLSTQRKTFSKTK